MQDLNTAPKSELLKVDQIGPVLADRLLASRPFKDWDAVRALPQICLKRVTNLQTKFCIGGGSQRQTQKALTQEKTNCAIQQDKVNDWVCVPAARVPQNLGERATPQPRQQQGSGQSCNAKMSLNTATKEQIMQAYQIGPALARDLINARPFESWEEVAELSGIGKIRVASLQSLLLLASVPKQSVVRGKPIPTSSEKTFTLQDVAKAFKLLSDDPSRHDSAPNGYSSAISEHSFKTASSDKSMLSADGPRCFLPHTVLPISPGNYKGVETLKDSDLVLSADGSMVKITSLKVHEKAHQKCVQLCAGDVTNEFTEGHRVSIWRAGKKQAARAETLRVGDDVFMSGGETQKLSDVTFFTQECEVYEIMFQPDVPVESYPVVPGSILTHGQRIRRSHKRASFKGSQPSSIPDTDSEWGFAEFEEGFTECS